MHDLFNNFLLYDIYDTTSLLICTLIVLCHLIDVGYILNVTVKLCSLLSCFYFVCKPCLMLISTPPPPHKNFQNIYKFDNKIYFSYKFILDYLNLCI